MHSLNNIITKPYLQVAVQYIMHASKAFSDAVFNIIFFIRMREYTCYVS